MIESKTANTSITQTLIEIIRKQAKKDNNTVLEQINNTINWDRLVSPIKDKIDSSLVGESKTFDIKTIFKCFVLQTIYELSNHELAVEISDRKSFQKFLGLQYGDTVPKEDTLSFFRELLKQENLYDDIFNAFYEQLLDAKFQMFPAMDEKNAQFYQDYGVAKEIEKEEDTKYKLGVQSRVDNTEDLFDEIESINLEGTREVSKTNNQINNGNNIDDKINEIEKRIRMLYDRKSQEFIEEPSEEVTLGDKLKKVDDEIKMINQEPEELVEKTDQIYQKLLQIDNKIGELYDIPQEEVPEEKEVAKDKVSEADINKSEKLLNKLLEIDERLKTLQEEPVEKKEDVKEIKEEEIPVEDKESKATELFEKLTQIDHRLKELYEKPLEVEDKVKSEAEEIVEKAKDLKVKEDIEKGDIREEEIDKIEQVEDEKEKVIEEKPEMKEEEKIEAVEKEDLYKRLFDSFYSHLIDANIVKETEKEKEIEKKIEDTEIKPVFSEGETASAEIKDEKIEPEVKEEEVVKDEVVKDEVEIKEEKLEPEEEIEKEAEGVLESQEFKMRSEEIDEKVKEIEDQYKLLYDKEFTEPEMKEEIKEEVEVKEEIIEEKVEAPEIEEKVEEIIEEKVEAPEIEDKVEEKIEEDLIEPPKEIEEIKETHIETTEDKLKKIDEEIKKIYKKSEIEQPVVEEVKEITEQIKVEEPEIKEAVDEVKEEIIEETEEIKVEKTSTAFMQPPVEVQEPEVKKIRDNEIDLKKKRKVEIFNDSNLTEDYELGLRFYKLGFKTAFVNMTTGIKDAMSRIATAEYFPNTFWGAVKQRSRWIAGIAFQNWKIHKWKGSLKTKYFLLRDRKSLISAIGILLSNIVFAYFVIYLASITFNFQFTIPLIEKGTVLWYLMLGTFFFMISRIIHRFAFTYNWYGLRYAIFSIVRLPFDNIINIFATARAFKVYRTNKKKVVWDSTDHY